MTDGGAGMIDRGAGMIRQWADKVGKLYHPIPHQLKGKQPTLGLDGGSMWESMAIAIMFGLLFSTMLTLLVVPVLYSIFFWVKFKGFSY